MAHFLKEYTLNAVTAKRNFHSFQHDPCADVMGLAESQQKCSHGKVVVLYLSYISGGRVTSDSFDMWPKPISLNVHNPDILAVSILSYRY